MMQEVSLFVRQKPFVKWLLFILLIFGFAWICSNYLYQLMMIQGDSMMPSYHNLQLVVLDKHTQDYKTNDVIAFDCEGLKAVLVKRIVAEPGDRVRIQDGVLWVNDKKSSSKQGKTYLKYAGILENEIHLGIGEYIVLGDNIDVSKDSRYEEVGIVKGSDIIGEVVW